MKAALVGAGVIGRVHADSIGRMAGLQLQAVCDPDARAAEALAAPHGARVFPSFDGLLRSPVAQEIGLVLVCVPTHLHEEVVLSAAGAGMAVFCEKPVALREDAASRMIEACQKAGAAFGVGHVVRFFPEYALAAGRLRAGGLGELGTVRAFRGGSYPRGWDDWYGDDERSGGVMVDLMIHDLDFVDSSVGAVESLFARRMDIGHRTGRDHALVVGRLENGALIHLEASWAHASGFRYGFEIAGRKGILDFHSERTPSVELRARLQGTDGRPGAAIPESPLAKSPYQLELEAFVSAVEGGKRPPVDGPEALRALSLSLAAARSARTGEPVRIAPRERDGARKSTAGPGVWTGSEGGEA